MRLRGAKNSDSSMETPVEQNGGKRKKVLASEPMHMTTRAAASKTASVATGSPTSSVAAQSVAPSLTSSDSRRDSLREATFNVGGSDIDSTRPSKVARMSLRSSRGTSGSNSSESRENGTSNGEDPPSRKSSLAETLTAGDGEVGNVAESLLPPELQGSFSDRAPTASRTPVVRRSPIKRGGKGSRSLRGILAVGSSARIESPGTPNRALDGDLTDRQSPGKNEPGGVLERLPGRKRAMHHDPEIEIALRRQLELKVAYRAVVKALKPVLIELANRTAQEQQEEIELHKNYADYNHLIQELDKRLNSRVAYLDAKFRERGDHLRRMKEGRDEMAKSQFARILHDKRDDYILRCQHEFLTVSRGAVSQYDDDATQYDGDIVPPLYTFERVPEVNVSDGNKSSKQTSASQTIRVPLAPEYESRSRVFLEIERLWNEHETRHHVGMKLREYDEASFVRKPKDFAVYNGDQRRAAIAHLNLASLIEAGKEVEQNAARPAKPIIEPIANEDATGLQALAAAIEMAPALQMPGSNRLAPASLNVGSPAGQVPGHYVNANYKISSEPLKKPVMPPLRGEGSRVEGPKAEGSRAETSSTEGKPPREPSTASNPRPPYLQQRMVFGPSSPFISPYPIPQESQHPQPYHSAPPHQQYQDGIPPPGMQGPKSMRQRMPPQNVHQSMQPQDISQSMLSQSTSQSMPPKNTAQSMPQTMPQTMPQDMPQNMSQNVPQNMLQNIAHNVPQNMPQNTAHNMPQHTAQSMHQNMSQNSAQTMHQNMPRITAQNMHQNTGQNTAQSMPQNAAQNVPQHSAQNVPQNVAQNMHQNLDPSLLHQHPQPGQSNQRQFNAPEKYHYQGGPAPAPQPTPSNAPPRSHNATRVPAVEASRSLPRKRPGPRPHYSSQVEPDYASHPHGGQPWRPFTNTMGPPTHLPKYIKGTEPARNSSPASSTGAPSNTQNLMQSGFDQRTNVNSPSQERRMSSDQGRPREGSYGQVPPSEMHARTLPSMRPAYAHENMPPQYGPPPVQQPTMQKSPRSANQEVPVQSQHPQSNQLPPILQQYNQPGQPKQSSQPVYYGPISYYDTHAGRMTHPATHSTPLQQTSSSFSNTQPSNTYPLPPPPPQQQSNYYPGPAPPSQPAQAPNAPPQQQQQQQQLGTQPHNRTSSLPSLAPSLPPLAPNYAPQPRHESFSHAAVGRHLQQQPGQAGHQPILPATLDPNRRKSQQMATTSGTPPATGGAGINVAAAAAGQRNGQQEWRNYTSILPAPAAPIAQGHAQGGPGGPGVAGPGNMMGYAPGGTNLPPQSQQQMYQQQPGPGAPYHQPLPHALQQHPQQPYQPTRPYPPPPPSHRDYPPGPPQPPLPPYDISTTAAKPTTRESTRRGGGVPVAVAGSNSRGKVREWRFQTGQGRSTRGTRRGGAGAAGGRRVSTAASTASGGAAVGKGDGKADGKNEASAGASTTTGEAKQNTTPTTATEAPTLQAETGTPKPEPAPSPAPAPAPVPSTAETTIDPALVDAVAPLPVPATTSPSISTVETETTAPGTEKDVSAAALENGGQEVK